MTVDANLILGVQMGVPIGFLLGGVVAIVFSWVLMK